MKHFKEGQKRIRRVGFAALVKTSINVAGRGQPPKLIEKFLRVGPCLPNRDMVEKYLKEDYRGVVADYRIVGVRVDETPYSSVGNRGKSEN